MAVVRKGESCGHVTPPPLMASLQADWIDWQLEIPSRWAVSTMISISISISISGQN